MCLHLHHEHEIIQDCFDYRNDNIENVFFIIICWFCNVAVAGYVNISQQKAYVTAVDRRNFVAMQVHK